MLQDESEIHGYRLYDIYHRTDSRKKFVDEVLGQPPIYDRIVAEVIWECIDRAVDLEGQEEE